MPLVSGVGGGGEAVCWISYGAGEGIMVLVDMPDFVWVLVPGGLGDGEEGEMRVGGVLGSLTGFFELNIYVRMV